MLKSVPEPLERVVNCWARWAFELPRPTVCPVFETSFPTVCACEGRAAEMRARQASVAKPAAAPQGAMRRARRAGVGE